MAEETRQERVRRRLGRRRLIRAAEEAAHGMEVLGRTVIEVSRRFSSPCEYLEIEQNPRKGIYRVRRATETTIYIATPLSERIAIALWRLRRRVLAIGRMR